MIDCFILPKKWLLLFFLFLNQAVFAQIFSESFSYPQGTLLTNTGWVEHSGNAQNPLTVQDFGHFDGDDKATGIRLQKSGQDVNHTFKPVKNNAVYLACLINVNTATEEGDYFLHLGAAEMGTTFRGKLWVKASDGHLKMGISKASNSPVWASPDFEFNKTYQVVIKYSFLDSSTSDDLVSLYVLDKKMNYEPQPILVTGFNESDLPVVGSVGIRQGSGAKSALLKLDEIRVSTQWEEATRLTPAYTAQIQLPTLIYGFDGNCRENTVFKATLNAHQPSKVLSLWSADGRGLVFSKDKQTWAESLDFEASDGRFLSDFYIKIIDDSAIADTVRLTLENEQVEEIASYTLAVKILKLSKNCELPIGDLTYLENGEKIKINGILTATAQNFPDFNYIEDATGGVRINGDFGFERGTSGFFEGLKSEINQEIVLIADSSLRSSAQFENRAEVQPKLIAANELNKYGGRYVQIDNVELADKNFVFLPDVNEKFVDGTQMRIWWKTKIAGHLKPQGKFSVSGIVGKYFDQYQLYPIKPTEIEQIGTIPNYELFEPSKKETFDLLTWNLEWFGSTALGPKDEDLQLANAIKILKSADADMMVLEEISQLASFDKLLAGLPGFDGQCSPAVSNGSEVDGQAQRVCFIYRKSMVEPLQLKVLLSQTKTIADYPEGFERFWASGRYPAMLKCRVKLNGISTQINVVGIHAKANRNDAIEREKAYQMRMKDIAVLKDSLDVHYPLVKMIVAGDFNDDVDQSVTAGFPLSTYWPFGKDKQHYAILSEDLSNKGFKSYLGFENVIDHIIISDELKNETVKGTTQLLLPFLNTAYYANTTSDHLPLMSRFLLDEDEINSDFFELDSSMVYAQKDVNDVSLPLDKNLRAEMWVYDLSGKEIMHKQHNLVSLNYQLSKKLAQKPSGVFLIKILIGNSVKTYKIVTQP